MEIFHTLLSGLGYIEYMLNVKNYSKLNIEGFITVFLESYCTIYLH